MIEAKGQELCFSAAVNTPPPISCGHWEWTQTYYGWGPALYYSQEITIVYQSRECSVSLNDNGYTLQVGGSATVHAGNTPDGKVLEMRHFENRETWELPRCLENGLLSYACSRFAKQVEQRCRIQGVYECRITNQNSGKTVETLLFNEKQGIWCWA